MFSFRIALVIVVTLHTVLLIDEQQVTETNDIFDLAVTHPPLEVAS